MARFLFGGAHDGNMINGLAPVAKELHQRGHEVLVVLQEGLSAAGNFERREKLWEDLQGIPVQVSSEVPESLSKIDAVILATSTPTGRNLEIELLAEAKRCGIPAYAVEEVVGGRHNPSWRPHLGHLTALFVPVPEEGFTACPEVVVGPLALERWRNVSVAALAGCARAKLGLGNEPVLYFFPSPARESPTALHVLGRLLARTRSEEAIPEDVVLLLNRHRREMVPENTIPGSAEGFRSGLRYISEVAGLRVFDNSPEYDILSATDSRSPLPEFRPPEFLDYMEMLAVTAGNGVALTFFGTDSLMVAPFLAKDGIMSVLWLDPVLGGRLLRHEKQQMKFNLPLLTQSFDDDALSSALWVGLSSPQDRKLFCDDLAVCYPFPPSDPAVTIAERILEQLSV